MLGYIARCDGGVNGKEIRRTHLYGKTAITPECRTEAKELFEVGAKPGFDFHETLVVALAVQDASDSDVTKAYRKLVNQYHADKLMDTGFPPEMLDAANERFRSGAA